MYPIIASRSPSLSKSAKLKFPGESTFAIVYLVPKVPSPLPGNQDVVLPSYSAIEMSRLPSLLISLNVSSTWVTVLVLLIVLLILLSFNNNSKFEWNVKVL